VANIFSKQKIQILEGCCSLKSGVLYFRKSSLKSLCQSGAEEERIYRKKLLDDITQDFAEDAAAYNKSLGHLSRFV